MAPDAYVGTAQAQQVLEQTLPEPMGPPQPSGTYHVDENVIIKLPKPGTRIVHALNYGESLWGKTAKIIAELPSGEIVNYFLKVVTLGDTGRVMCHGEYESLREIHKVTPDFVPEPYSWGSLATAPETYFLLTQFRDVGEQPADPVRLANRLADLHQRSKSPFQKFGFHIATCHARITQAVNTWEESWCTLYSKNLGHVMELAKQELQWREFDIVCKLTLEKVVPRLLLPLQEEGRHLKPCLIHGDCWDGNTAMDMRTGEAFVFDVCSFYGHNEYDTGNWRAPRHRLSNKSYIQNYKKNFPVSEPEEDWDDRNLLYSLTFNIGNTIYIPGSSQREVVYDDMTKLCNKFCPDDFRAEMSRLKWERLSPASLGAPEPQEEKQYEEEGEGKEEDEEEEEEEEEE